MASTIKWTPLSPHFGAELDFDAKRVMSEEEAQVWRRLFQERHLLLVRGCDLTAEEQVRLMSTLGRIVSDLPDGSPCVMVSNVLKEGILGNTELAFHSDLSFCPEPTGGISMLAVEVESGRSSTRFVNGVEAFRRLSAPLRARLQGLKARHLLTGSGGRLEQRPVTDIAPNLPTAVHDVIKVHPVSGLPILYVTEMATDRIIDLADEQSAELLDELFGVLYADDNEYEHRWQQGDLVIWDNLALQHARGDMSNPGRRTLRKVNFGSRSMYEQFPAFRTGAYGVLTRR